MSAKNTIDDDLAPAGYETFSIFTDDSGSRYISYGCYLYDAESSIYPDPAYTWRCVQEYIRVPLNDFIEWFDEHHTVSGHPAELDRPLDVIVDHTYEQAKEIFSELLDECIYMDGSEIRPDTPDGDYIGKLF